MTEKMNTDCLSFEEAISKLKMDPKATLEYIMSSEKLKSNNENVLLSQIQTLSLNKTNPEFVLECFLNLVKFDSKFLEFLYYNGYYEKQDLEMKLNREKVTDLKNSISENYKYMNKSTEIYSEDQKSLKYNLKAKFNPGFQIPKYIYDIAKQHNLMNNSKISVYSYLILAFYFSEVYNYSGEYEIYYIIDYLFNSEDFEQQKSILLRWASSSKENKCLEVLNIPLQDFFYNEIKYIKQSDFIMKLILTRKSHRILNLKFNLILKSFLNTKEDSHKIVYRDNSSFIFLKANGQRNARPSDIVEKSLSKASESLITENREYENLYSSTSTLCENTPRNTSISHLEHDSSNTNNSLSFKELLINSYSKSEKTFTEVILERLNDETIIKEFSAATGFGTKLFFKICHTIDQKYIEAILNNIEYIESISNEDLTNLHDSEYFYFVVKKYRIFQKIVDLMILKTINFDSSKFFKNTSKRNDDLYLHDNDSIRSLRSEKDVDLYKINYLVDRNIKVKREIFIKNLNSTDGDIIAKIFLKMKDYKAIEDVYEYVSTALIDKLFKSQDFSIFYIRCLNFIIRKGIDISKCKIVDDLSPHALVLKSKIRGYNTDENTNALTLCWPVCTRWNDIKTVYEDINDGLYMYEGFIRILNRSKKFTLHATFIREKLSDKNVLVSFDKELKIFVCDNSVYLKNHLKTKRIFDIDPTNSKRLNVEIRFNSSKLKININGREKQISYFVVNKIVIGELFKGSLKDLCYFELLFPCTYKNETDIEYYRYVIAPVQKILKYYQKSGVAIKTTKPFYLNGEVDIKVKDVIEFKKPI